MMNRLLIIATFDIHYNLTENIKFSLNSFILCKSFFFSFLNLLEEFNDRILRPELSNDEMLSLHEELQKIYKTYCLDESVDKIRFDPFIVEEIQKSK